MTPADEIVSLRLLLTQSEAVIAELRGVVAELRKQIESQQAHIHRLVKLTFGRGGERVEGPTLFDALTPPITSRQYALMLSPDRCWAAMCFRQSRAFDRSALETSARRAPTIQLATTLHLTGR